MYNANQIKEVVINYDNELMYYEVNIDDLLYISKSTNDLINDKGYQALLISKGYTKIVPDFFRYNMNEHGYSTCIGIYDLNKYFRR